MAGLVSAAEGIRAMEEALREISESTLAPPHITDIARRALSTWDTRGRLRDDEAWRFAMEEVVYRCAGLSSVSTDFSGQILDAIDRLLDTAVLGTPTRGKEGPT